jgi:rhodanese-related sulfurtransferase
VVKKANVQQTFDAIKDPNVAFIDVRESDELASVATKAAKHFPMSALEPATFAKDSGIPVAKPLYILCRSGSRSMRVATALLANGFKDVYNVEGGIIAWEAHGLPVVKP